MVDLLCLTKERKQDLFVAFAKNSPYFPHHCVDIAYVLSNYLQNKNIKHEIRMYYKKYNKRIRHYVIMIENKIIDFSLCQFYLKNKPTKKQFEKMTKEECIEYYYEEHQRGECVFEVDTYEKWFNRSEEKIQYGDKKLTLLEYVNFHFKNRQWEAKSIEDLLNLLNEENILKI